MEQKTVGILQIIIGVLFLILFASGLVIGIIVGDSIIEVFIKGIVSLLFGFFALITGWNTLNK